MALPEIGSDLSAWASSLPTEFLLAELSRRQDGDSAGATDTAEPPQPACGTKERGAYDTPLHVFALVLILTLSTIACGFPLFSRRSSKSRRTSYFVFLCQHFGTGVLIATAFVHLLPTAFVSLTNPCLPYAFSEGYQPMAGLVAMISAMSVVVLESYLTTRGASHHHHHHGWESDDEDVNNKFGSDQGPGLPNGNNHKTSGLAASRNASHRPSDIAMGDVGASQGLMADVSPMPGMTPVVDTTPASPGDPHRAKLQTDSDSEDDDLDLDMDELDPTTAEESRSLAPQAAGAARQRRHDDQHDIAAQGPSSPEEQKRLMLQCMLLEAGILFHSVFIGMAVSVATGPPFVVFLTAIAFHQTFEGLALGSRIAAINFPRSSVRPWLMVLAYGCTTPLGQAIGLAVHTLYDPMSQTGLLVVGFMNAISSGLLLFAGLVQLLAEDFLTEKSYRSLKGKERLRAGGAVLAGAMLMALVGAFA
ncbi:Zinc/iron permease [Microdochium trichocladiopsis]|uniref:Zinc/iron permease n=1 Tax=Microdochium trichocladiopsis TaxID=1682393 RepID=A0A9P9BSI6_9PEZI|nr:Zinc/iron permease [Microdochium trichocladiopsis]KAH7034619.1 Zinc/iron permease [Microdochium trichocladiopsis]